ncbi:MAG: AI-2E family transporter [Fidelibacterota bacterium]
MDDYAFQLYSHIVKMFWRVFAILLGIAVVIVVFPYVKSVLVMFVFALLLAVLLNPVVDFLESHGVHRGVSILITMLLIVGIIAFTVSLIIPGIIRAVESLSSKLQSNVINDINRRIETFFAVNFNNAELARNVTSKFNEIGLKLLSKMAEFFKSVGSFMASIAIVPFITFFLIKDIRQFKRALIAKIPNKYFEMSLNVLQKVGHQVSKYIQGQATDAFIVGCLSVLGLFIINQVFDNPVPQFVFIGMIAGVANLIPYLGPIVGAVPALLVAILSNPANLGVVLLWIIITFVLVQVIDNSFVSPMVVSKSVDMHPLTVVIVVIIGGNLAGAVGMLFAVPVTGIIKVTLTEVIWGLKNYKLE